MKVSPKLVVSDADHALDFYCQVFGGTVEHCFAHAGQVVFASMSIGESEVQVKDADAHDPVGTGVIVDVVCSDPDAVMARAKEQGGEEIFPVADQPYGVRQGRFRDPFGHQWIIGTPITWSDDEIQGALDAMG